MKRRLAGPLTAALAVLSGCIGAAPSQADKPAPGNGQAAAAPAPAPAMPAPPPAPALPVANATIQLIGTLTQGTLLRGVAPAGTRTLTLDGSRVALAPDGRFIIGINRDAPATARLVASTANGPVVRDLVIAPRAWRIENVPGVPKYPVPTAAFNRLRPAELALINGARHKVTDAAGWQQSFDWPARGRLSGFFGSQRVYGNGEKGSYHTGLDIAAPAGAVVRAPADGVVILAAPRPFTLEGNLLMLDHGMGLSSAFLHLSRIDVKDGDHVRRGQPIGLVGMTGRATGPHLHWAVKWNDARLDPLLVLGEK